MTVPSDTAADGPGTGTPEEPGLGLRDEGPLFRWLLEDAWTFGDTAALVHELAHKAVEDGIPLFRMRLTIRTLHPQVIGVSYTWDEDTDAVAVFEPPHSIVQTDQFLRSPYASIFEGAGAIRRRLEGPGAVLDFPVLVEIHEQGATDYVAMPIHFSDGQINVITLATRKTGGFSSEQLGRLYALLMPLSRILEVHAMRRTAHTLLDTYLGRHTGEQVLNGHIRRGDGETINAVIWFCDLRDSTALAESMSREAFLGILNDYYDCMAGAVLEAGGEVLRFIGDAALAIFPIGTPGCQREGCDAGQACRSAVNAALAARGRMDALNTARRERGEAPLGFGLALHIGELTYGNIGVPGRLEFTVIGAAANEAAKLEALCKPLGRSLLVSEAVTRVYPRTWQSLGQHDLPGIPRPREIFTLPDSEWPPAAAPAVRGEKVAV